MWTLSMHAGASSHSDALRIILGTKVTTSHWDSLVQVGECLVLWVFSITYRWLYLEITGCSCVVEQLFMISSSSLLHTACECLVWRMLLDKFPFYREGATGNKTYIGLRQDVNFDLHANSFCLGKNIYTHPLYSSAFHSPCKHQVHCFCRTGSSIWHWSDWDGMLFVTFQCDICTITNEEQQCERE